MKKILLLTHSKDNDCIAAVTSAIEKRGGQAIRFNTDQYPGAITLSMENAGTDWRYVININGILHDLSTFEALWYRRIFIGDGLKGVLDEQFLHPSIEESRKSFFGMLFTLDIFHLDHVEIHRRAEHKQLQLKIAEAVGLNTPKTLTTNDAGEVRAFMKALPGGVVTKMQASFAIYENGEENVVFTNALEADQDLEGLEYCPMVFQQRLEKQRELRITIVGEEVFAAAIDSQVIDNAKVDWRKEGHALMNNWKAHDLPANTKNQLLALMDRLQLNYGAIDMILTPDNELYFLEVNPGGEFWWQEITGPQFPITEALAAVLMGESPRRSQ